MDRNSMRLDSDPVVLYKVSDPVWVSRFGFQRSQSGSKTLEKAEKESSNTLP